MGAVGVIITIAILSFGVAAWMFKKSKPKKVGYQARVYKKVGTGADADIQLYTKDYLVKLTPAIGITKWKLEKTGLFLPREPSAEVINVEGNEKVVDLLLDHSKIAILKKGYDTTKDKLIFESYDFDKHAFCELKRAYHIKRLDNNKNPLEYITKWIVVALTMFGLVAISYVQAEGWVNSSENNKLASENTLKAANIQANATKELQKILTTYNKGAGIVNPNPNIITTQNEVKSFG